MLEKIFGLWLDLDWVLTNQDWIWIVKYDSLLISVANSALVSKRLATPRLHELDRLSQRSGEEGVTFVRSCRINRLLFADDLVLLASFQQGLQHALDRISVACDRARMKISTKNTEVLCLCTNQRQCMLQVSGIHCSRWRNSSTQRWYLRVTEGGARRLMHELLKLMQFCVSFIDLRLQNGTFQTPRF